ncbi:MAG: hypothetical protein FWG50_05820 [Kiritimatiellaeota bacterium]|nr:hypothetical protein [Kiritimatiellota bacterium]
MKSRTSKKPAKRDGMVNVNVKMTVAERGRIKERGAREQRSVSAEIRYRMGMAYGAEASA